MVLVVSYLFLGSEPQYPAAESQICCTPHLQTRTNRPAINPTSTQFPKRKPDPARQPLKKKPATRIHECPSREHHCNVNRGRVGWPGAKGKRSPQPELQVSGRRLRHNVLRRFCRLALREGLKKPATRIHECPSREYHCNVNRGRVGWPGAKG